MISMAMTYPLMRAQQRASAPELTESHRFR
jgi:hypothetical protein